MKKTKTVLDIDAIAERFKQGAKLGPLAREYGLSLPNFCTKIKRVTGKTLSELAGLRVRGTSVHDWPTIFQAVRELVKQGETIQKACRIKGIHAKNLYTNINEIQKAELRAMRRVSSVTISNKVKREFSSYTAIDKSFRPLEDWDFD